MGWAKFDDKWHVHPKIVAMQRLAGQTSGLDSDPAIAGAWALGITWCNDNLTDGHITLKQLREFAGARAEEFAEIFVRVRLWHPSDITDEFGLVTHGWVYHDYLEYQFSRAQVKAKRAREKRRKAIGNMPHLRAKILERDGDYCRYCGCEVNWLDRRSTLGGTWDHCDPAGENVLDNVVVACRGCNSSKGELTAEEWVEEGGRPLLPAPADLASTRPVQGAARSGRGRGVDLGSGSGQNHGQKTGQIEGVSR